MLNYIGNIDAALSTASLRAGLTNYTTPTIIAHKKELVAKDLYHPLIENCVANSINIQQKSILITGSNMSGKSTFIRAVAINSILAQTIYTCFAAEFTTPVLKVLSSIRIADNVQEGAQVEVWLPGGSGFDSDNLRHPLLAIQTGALVVMFILVGRVSAAA